MDKTTKMIGEKLKKIREDKGLTLREVADKTGIHFTYIGKLENGQHKANLEMINKLCKFYNISVSSLFGETVEVPKELQEMGVEWITFAKEMKKENLTPEQIKKIIEVVTELKTL